MPLCPVLLHLEQEWQRTIDHFPEGPGYDTYWDGSASIVSSI